MPWSSRRQRRHSLQLILAVLTTTVVVSLAAVGASANPDIKSKQEQARAILAQVQQLDREVEHAAENWNGANYKLGLLSQQLLTSRQDLVRLRGQLKIGQGRAAARLREIYMHGAPVSLPEVLLGARSLDGALSLIDATNRVAAQDARIIRQLRLYRATVATQEKRLATARAAQAEIVAQRAAEKQMIEGKLAERKRLLSSVEAEVQQLQTQERARQAELRRQAFVALARERAAAQAQAAAQARLNSSGAGQAQTDGAQPTTPDPSPTPTDGSTATAPPPADASKGAQVVAIAMQYLGVPYVWGGASPSGGFDCSGLTVFVFAQVGVSLPHYAAAQYGMGVAVSKDQLQPGDLVFFDGLGHMGMYIGGGNFIHAPHTGDVVKISSLSESNYVANWVGARRVL